MFRPMIIFRFSLLLTFICASKPLSAETQIPESTKLFDRVSPASVAVEYELKTELRSDKLVFSGVVISPDGLVMVPLAAVSDRFPDEQMKDFKILVPHEGGVIVKLDAVFQGRDPRYEIAFVKAREPQRLTSINFEDVPPAIGDAIFSVGLTPRAAGIRPYLMHAMVSTHIVSDIGTENILVDGGGLAVVGSAVFNADGQAIGWVAQEQRDPLFLNDNDSMLALTNPPKVFTPTARFKDALINPPTPGHPVHMAWIGLPALEGLSEERCKAIGLDAGGAIKVGSVIKGVPAAEAGLKDGDIIVALNGIPLASGDDSNDLPQSFYRQIICLSPGTPITVTLWNGLNKTTRDVIVQLKEQPEGPASAERYWAEAFGFGARELVLLDRYSLKLDQDAHGVVLTAIKMNSDTGTALLRQGDLLTNFNNHPIMNLADFRSTCENLKKAHSQNPIPLSLLRHGREVKLDLKP